jgi:hypothetical protein
MNIDYDRQFKQITFAEALTEINNWKRYRLYHDPKPAFVSAARSEARGVSVAFAKDERGVYWVWSGEVSA